MELHVELLEGLVLLEPGKGAVVLDVDLDQALDQLLDLLLVEDVADLGLHVLLVCLEMFVI
jgi:hypothetical protein